MCRCHIAIGSGGICARGPFTTVKHGPEVNIVLWKMPPTPPPPLVNGYLRTIHVLDFNE